MASKVPERTDETGRRYEDFLLAEYDHVAQAHFATVSTISTFFKHYLIIISLPMPFLALLSREADVKEVLRALGAAVPIGGVLIALVGLLVMCYVANLRFDALLYARAVNGIRKYFCDRSRLPSETLACVHVLPTSIRQPAYFESRYFLFVVLTFALLDSAYLFAACLWHVTDSTNQWVVALAAGGESILFHLYAYARLARWREETYLT